jgi:hypothetical protein
MPMKTEDVAKQLGVPADDPWVQADLETLARAGHKPTTPPAGWYPVQGRLRWWDGTAWTNNWEKRPDKSWSTSAQVGMGLAIFIPFIGFLMGLALVAGKDRHAHWVVLTSIAVPLLAVLLLLR